MTSIEDAILLATKAHRTQVDKAGLPYILHPLRVMAAFVRTEEGDARMVAVLHDVVEDTDITLEALAVAGYPANVLQALDAISRRRGESYEDYIERVVRNELARRVKLADLRDNLDLERPSTWLLSKRIDKYHAAFQRLSGTGDAHG